MTNPKDADDLGTQKQMIGASHVRRLLVSLIEAQQEPMLRNGALSPDHMICAVSQRLGTSGLDAATIDETELGFDSLARLDLVMAVTRYFGLATTGVEDYLLVQRRLIDWVEIVCWHFSKIGPQAAITVTTSGSTGEPKTIEHSRYALESEIEAILSGPLSGPYKPKRVLSLVAPHHIYGFLWTVLLPEHAQCEAVDLPRGLATTPFRLAKPGDLLIATPYVWTQMARVGTRLPSGVSGVCSGGPTTPELWQTACDIGLERLIEVYGASETGGIGWRDSADAGFTLMGDLTQDNAGLHRPGNPAPLSIQDRLSWCGQERFTVQGRLDHVVQVAGTNVNLTELREQILAETGAKDAAIRLDGARLKAFIAVCDTRRPLVEAAVQKLLANLPAPARPDRIRFGPDLPRSDAGKLADWAA